MGRLTLVGLCVVALVALLATGARAAPYEPDQVIVKYADGASKQQRTTVMRRSGATNIVGHVLGVGAAVLRVKRDPARVSARLNRSPLVEYAEPNLILHAAWYPNDPRFGDQYGLTRIQAPAGWVAAGLEGFPATGGVRVGVIDTGIDQTHPDLSGQTVACASSLDPAPLQVGSCADGNGHGTHVAGILAAKANNGVGVAGVAFNADLVVCKALDDEGSGTLADVASCIGWARMEGAKVISMSLEGPPATTLQNAVTAAWSGGNGALVVAAAGNEGDDTVAYPAGYPEAMSVAATDENDAHADFSNANPDVEIAAPGVDIISTVPGGGYAELSGTSMSTPYVSGAAADIWQHFPSDSALAIRMRLDGNADDLGPGGRDSTFGFGRLNLCRAAGGAC
jgi:thermitase